MMRDRMNQMACAQILCESKNISSLEVLQSSVDVLRMGTNPSTDD